MFRVYGLGLDIEKQHRSTNHMIWGGITVEVIHMDQAVLGTQYCLLIRYLYIQHRYETSFWVKCSDVFQPQHYSYSNSSTRVDVNSYQDCIHDAQDPNAWFWKNDSGPTQQTPWDWVKRYKFNLFSSQSPILIIDILNLLIWRKDLPKNLAC
jgi:hypothetical protein